MVIEIHSRTARRLGGNSKTVSEQYAHRVRNANPENRTMTKEERAKAIIQDILINHLPRITEGLEKGYVDENQILVMYDHAVRARMLTEHFSA